jgi:CO/xanthine dehydrogenase Mo-binding subunit
MQNLLEKGDRIGTGAPVTQPLRFNEMCNRALRHPLWQEQQAKKAYYAKHNKSYGVGFALANQAYGTGKDGVMAAVSLGADGKIIVQTNAVDMGNGSATTLALATAANLGNNANQIDMGEVTVFDALDLSSDPTQNSNSTDPKKSWQNSYYTSAFSMSSSACITAFQQFHAVTQASKVLFDVAIWPAAAKLWKIDPDSPLKTKAKWQKSELTLSGHPALSMTLLASQIHQDKGVKSAMIHACFEGAWVRSSFVVNQQTHDWDIDGLNLLTTGQNGYQRYPRQAVVKQPPKNAGNYGRNLFSPSATLVAVIIDNDTAQVTIDAVHSYLNAGTIHQPDLVSGQYQGGVAMGVGYALLENLPPDKGGNGRWNLNRYHVALATDLPIERITLETLKPIDNEPGRGIAEAVLCPVAPAIANAISSATGGTFEHLPITPKKIKQVLA